LGERSRAAMHVLNCIAELPGGSCRQNKIPCLSCAVAGFL
jgi:hypothetical protein